MPTFGPMDFRGYWIYRTDGNSFHLYLARLPEWWLRGGKFHRDEIAVAKFSYEHVSRGTTEIHYVALTHPPEFFTGLYVCLTACADILAECLSREGYIQGNIEFDCDELRGAAASRRTYGRMKRDRYTNDLYAGSTIFYLDNNCLE